MSPRRMLVMARKEVLQILRDWRSLMIVILMPVVLVMLFGYGVNLDLKGLPVYVYDRDGSQQSQDLLRHFQASKYFHVVRVVGDYRDITKALDSGDAKMGIVVPWDFAKSLREGGPIEVQALVDATDDNTANVSIGYAQGVVQGYSSEIQLDWLSERGIALHPAAISVETRTNAYQVRMGEYPEEQLSVYVTARQYGSLDPDKTFVETVDRLRELCHETIDNHVIEHILQPLGRAIAMCSRASASLPSRR